MITFFITLNSKYLVKIFKSYSISRIEVTKISINLLKLSSPWKQSTDISKVFNCFMFHLLKKY